MRKLVLFVGLVWVAQTLTGPYAMWHATELLNSLPPKRAKEAKIFSCKTWQNEDALCVVYRDNK